MIGARFEVIQKKLFYFLDEIKTLRDGGASYFIGFGILIILLFPALILELVILLMSGKDLGWFQSSEYVNKRIVLKSGDVQESPRDLIPPAKKSAIGNDPDRDESSG